MVLALPASNLARHGWQPTDAESITITMLLRRQAHYAHLALHLDTTQVLLQGTHAGPRGTRIPRLGARRCGRIHTVAQRCTSVGAAPALVACARTHPQCYSVGRLSTDGTVVQHGARERVIVRGRR